MTTLLLLLALQDKSADRPLTGPAAKCGTEIPWLEDLDQAIAESKRTGKPIFWWVTAIPGSRMDRKLVLEKYMLSGPWMMPDLVAILPRRFVPLRMASDGNLDLRPMKFIEPGFVILNAKLEDVLRVDRISTFHEDHLRAAILKAAKAPPAGTTAEELFLEGAYEEALAKNPEPALRARILRRLGREFRLEDLPVEERALVHFARWDAPAAEKELAGAASDHARYLLGVALHLQARDDEGRAAWKKLVEEKPESRWAWKASAELARDGPFVRGFEVHATGSAVRYLLSMQRAHGGWDESQYHFGGDDSLPNVYMAGTALVALALQEWKDADPRVPKALERAERYLRDESKIAHDDTDEIVWAYAYRLIYFARTKDRKNAAAMVAALAKMQQRSGAFSHEYPNPFVTATVLHALWEGKQAGVEIPEGTVRRAVDALKGCRGKNGAFSYGMGRGGSMEGAAGRGPVCELGLVLWGASTNDQLKAAVEAAFKHHDLLERVRKYDDHADAWQNGGFFFWYDMFSRAEAIARLGDRAAAERMARTIRDIVEPDGAWVDSHELGRPYGTAMALLCLKRLGAK